MPKKDNKVKTKQEEYVESKARPATVRVIDTKHLKQKREKHKDILRGVPRGRRIRNI